MAHQYINALWDLIGHSNKEFAGTSPALMYWGERNGQIIATYRCYIGRDKTKYVEALVEQWHEEHSLPEASCIASFAVPMVKSYVDFAFRLDLT